MTAKLAAPPTAAPLGAIEVLALDEYTDLGDGLVVVTVGARADLRRDDGSPSQEGDVLSVQRDGSLQTRPAGSSGSFEIAKKTQAGLVYRPANPDGSPGRCFLVPCALALPE
jgi:hypothetical protein